MLLHQLNRNHPFPGSLVISGLADASADPAKGKFIPYRDSVLTWLLKVRVYRLFCSRRPCVY